MASAVRFTVRREAVSTFLEEDPLPSAGREPRVLCRAGADALQQS